MHIADNTYFLHKILHKGLDISIQIILKTSVDR